MANQQKNNRKSNGERITCIIKVVWPILVAIILVAVAWATQRAQVNYNTTEIRATKTVVDANKLCIARMEVNLENIEVEQKASRKDMKEGFTKLEMLLQKSP